MSRHTNRTRPRGLPKEIEFWVGKRVPDVDTVPHPDDVISRWTGGTKKISDLDAHQTPNSDSLVYNIQYSKKYYLYFAGYWQFAQLRLTSLEDLTQIVTR